MSIPSSTPLLLCALLLIGCQQESAVERANREGILIVGNSAEPKSLDLQLVSGVPESRILTSLFEGLCGDHPSEDGAMLPGAATSWEHNQDLTEWTFHLQPEAKWSDGVPVTSEDFLFSYHRMLNPQLAAAYAPMLHVIENAKAYNEDHRGYLLCGLDEQFPVDWEQLREVNFQGDPTIDVGDLDPNDFGSMARQDRRKLIAAKGLDRLGKEILQAIHRDGALFDWPPTIPEDARRQVIERLITHIQNGAPDLYEQAKVGISAPDQHTLKIKLREPVPYLPAMTRHTSWFPVPKHVVLTHGRMTDRFTEWSNLGNLVSNGPFQLKEWRYNHYIEVERNPHYWDAAQVGLNGIRYLPIENAYTETRAFLAGQLHTIYSLPPDLLGRARKQYPRYLRVEPYVGTVFLRLNTTRPGLNNMKVRRAISLAINREQLCKYIYEGFSPATALTPQLGEYVPPKALETNLEKARALLEEAGYPGGKGLPAFAILSTSKSNQSVAALQHTLGQIGIRITVENKDWGSYIAAQQELEYDISLAGWIGDYLDATTFLDMWTRGNGNNNTGWSSTEYEALLRKAAQQSDPHERVRILAQAEGILLHEAPIAPIVWYSRLYLHRPEVKGWHPLLLDNHPWKFISLESEP